MCPFFNTRGVENNECSTQINITNPFPSAAESEAFLNLDFGVFHEQLFHKLTSLTDVQKYDIILKHKKPAENKRSFVRNWLTEFP